MVSSEPKISKLGAIITRDTALIIPETLQIIRKPGSATSQSHYGSTQYIVDHVWYKETQETNHLQELRSVEVLSDDKRTI
jgi:hypothetical protein